MRDLMHIAMLENFEACLPIDAWRAIDCQYGRAAEASVAGIHAVIMSGAPNERERREADAALDALRDYGDASRGEAS